MRSMCDVRSLTYCDLHTREYHEKFKDDLLQDLAYNMREGSDIEEEEEFQRQHGTVMPAVTLPIIGEEKEEDEEDEEEGGDATGDAADSQTAVDGSQEKLLGACGNSGLAALNRLKSVQELLLLTLQALYRVRRWTGGVTLRRLLLCASRRGDRTLWPAQGREGRSPSIVAPSQQQASLQLRPSGTGGCQREATFGGTAALSLRAVCLQPPAPSATKPTPTSCDGLRGDVAELKAGLAGVAGRLAALADLLQRRPPTPRAY
uniref:TBP-binding protein ABT1 n=1 Tax=Macrostomum lignano TaxID=282301 RepID=A0A1I8F408_9PLAT